MQEAVRLGPAHRRPIGQSGIGDSAFTVDHRDTPVDKSDVGMAFENLLALGEIQRRAKQRRAARETLQTALEIFESLGAPLWAERTRQEIARIGGRAPSPEALTPGEQRVAELVADAPEQAFNLWRLRNVGLDDESVRASRADLLERQFCRRFVAQVVDGHVNAVFRELQRDAASDASRTPGDECMPCRDRHSEVSFSMRTMFQT